LASNRKKYHAQKGPVFELRNGEEDPYGESSAETMLKYLNPKAKMPDSVTIFTRHGYIFCARAKETLRHQNINYEELVLNDNFTIKTVRQKNWWGRGSGKLFQSRALFHV
jgi:hypothetical protein